MMVELNEHLLDVSMSFVFLLATATQLVLCYF